MNMNADFLAVLEFWEREKGISRDVLVGAVQESLLSAAKKAVGPARELRVAIDPKNGDIKAFAKLVVSERVISTHDQISVFDARRIKSDAQVVYLGMYTQFHVDTRAGRIVSHRIADESTAGLEAGSPVTLTWSPEHGSCL